MQKFLTACVLFLAFGLFSQKAQAQVAVYYCSETRVCTWSYGGGSLEKCKSKALTEAMGKKAKNPVLAASSANTGTYGAVVSKKIQGKMYWGFAVDAPSKADAESRATASFQEFVGNTTTTPSVNDSFQH